jgi:diketogulonate reductase-like aldo/keto reductase
MASVDTLLTRAIPSTGESIPVIGLGTWQTFDVGSSAAERSPREAVLRTFADSGGRLIDSSPMYGRAEEVVGDLSTRLGVNPQLFIATKVWTQGRAAGIRQMEASMHKLERSRVDLLQVHNLVDVDVHLDTLDGWQREGRVRYIGITHYNSSAHDEVARVLASRRIDFVQINYRSLNGTPSGGCCRSRRNARSPFSSTGHLPRVRCCGVSPTVRCRRLPPSSSAARGPSCC